MAQNFINRLASRNNQGVDIQPVLMDEYGNYDPLMSAQAGLDIKQQATPLTLNDRLFGREMTQDYSNFNPETNQAEMTTLTNYKPGFFNSLASGFNENYNQGFDVNNLMPQKKGFATRLGEGLGTLARFYDKPIGRMLAATGLSYLTGEQNPWNEGITAYVGRQNNMTADKAYRGQLKQMGMSENEVNSIPGIVNKDVFNSITNAMKFNNQRMTWGQLAQISPEIAEEVMANPELADQFIPINMARDIYGLKRDTAKSKMAEVEAKTKKTEAETKQVGKPKVSINIKQGGTTSTIKHEGGNSGSSNKSTRPTKQNYTQDEVLAELKRRGLR